jgi:hypothetical protein
VGGAEMILAWRITGPTGREGGREGGRGGRREGKKG